jgi:hypothetical protein
MGSSTGSNAGISVGSIVGTGATGGSWAKECAGQKSKCGGLGRRSCAPLDKGAGTDIGADSKTSICSESSRLTVITAVTRRMTETSSTLVLYAHN